MGYLLKQPLLYLALLAIGSSAGCIAIRDVRDGQEQPVSTPAPLMAPSTGTNPDYIAEIVQQVGAAVVRIDSSRTIQRSRGQDSVLEQFFGGQVPERRQVQRGTGSGFIISQDGRVLTNAHVVAGADSVSVVLKDGRQFDGRVLGTDRVTDVAVIKISANGLPTARLGNSDDLLPGQTAIAIGNPLGLSNTVTQGIISATQRSSAEVGVPTERLDFIQTDAAINPGNSGGPLLNAQGEVIGMNIAIIQGAQGIGFAIPINTAQQAAEQLVKKGRVEHPYIGLEMAELSPELRREMNQADLGFQVNQDRGVVVGRVAAGSPAAQAGLQAGDIIESVNGKPIENASQVQDRVKEAGIGNTLQFRVNRNGQSQAIAVRPTQLPKRES